jgi:ankyrin repeat protein
MNRLLAAGLDVDRRDDKGRTPLAWALFDGASAAVVHALLDAGADLRAREEYSERSVIALAEDYHRDDLDFLPGQDGDDDE